jgi:uncharacterized membrane protein
VKYSALRETLLFSTVAFMFLLAVMQWQGAPEQLPVHWNWQGQPDAFGGKARGLLALPLVALLVQLIVLAVPRFDPRRRNYERFAPAYNLLRYNLAGFFLLLYLAFLWSLSDAQVDAGRLFAALTGAFIVAMSQVVKRLHSNWFFGVRTPWTLSSRQSWEKTHKLAGKIFLAVGLVSIAASGFGTMLGHAFWVAGLRIGVLVLLIYSYLVWKADPKKDKIR